ncbi:MAG: DNA gyrase inhibitor YacG [Pseudomonadota bacterium]|nr:DNA gyrase inhibitor YacG [Pseudomonadota bacterium]
MVSVAKSNCPVCHAARVDKYRPFCSKRCSELDLGRWFTGSYAIPTEEMPDEFDIGMSDRQNDDD